MIKLFRNIRKKLLENGKLKSYLLYAVGEVFLVIIGILIAIQINKWNEGRINRNQVKDYVITLNEELKTNSSALDSRIESRLNEINSLASIVDALNNKLKDEEADSLINSLVNLGTNTFPPLSQSALNDIINSGLINNMKDLDLKYFLLNLENVIEAYDKANQEVTNYIFSAILPYYLEHSNLLNRGLEMDDIHWTKNNYIHNREAFVQNRELANIIFEYAGWQNYQKRVMEGNKIWFSELSKFIEQNYE